MAREMKIGIMPRDQFAKYTTGVAKGDIKPSDSSPTIWFDSIESMAQVLSESNRNLLRIIKDQKPQSLVELAQAAGRKTSNLSRTLKTMEKYGIVVLDRKSKSLKPSVLVDKFLARFAI